MDYPYSQAEHDEAVCMGGIALVSLFALSIAGIVAILLWS